MKFQKFLVTGCRDMDKKHPKYPKNGGFPPSVTPKIFFQKSSSVTFVLLWCPNFMQKTRKTNGQSLKYLKTDQWMDKGPRTDMGHSGQKCRKNTSQNFL